MKCPHCQAWNPDQAKFCMNCGERLPQVSSAVGAGETKSEFKLDRYLPQELVTKLEFARAHSSMMGERRIITMLFCDVKGSTAAAEKVDPEIWTEIMNGIFEHMIRPIYKYEGLVPRLMGDAILAFFGAPITHEDDPQRAVLAGLEIQEGIQAYAEEIRLRYGLEFGLRVGINTGLVVVGEIGSDLRMEYTAIGDAINLAARMEQTAAVGTIQISEDTYKLVAPFFNVEPLGAVEVKGKSLPIKTYRVLGVKSAPGQLRGLEGLSSPLVGRETQMTLLKDRLKELERGTGSVIAVIGEAGLGKSTLIAGLKKSSEGQPHSWLQGDALSYTRSISYYPWRQIIRQAIDAHDADTHAEVRDKLRYVSDRGRLPGGNIPFLEAILAVESEESLNVVMGFQGEALTQRMIAATRAFLCGLTAGRSLVIVFEDLHWADEASLNLLLNLADLSATQPILFLCMSRPDQTSAAWDSIQKMEESVGARFHSIPLTPLQVDQTETLLNHLLGEKDLPKSIRDLIIHKAEGNPFFVEELIRSLIETGQIVRENSHWKTMSASTEIKLPNTLRGVLSARIDRLPERSRHLLQNASVVGRSFDPRVLKRLTGLNGQFELQIQYLMNVSLIEAWQNEYAFRHVLIQEAAYESILLRTRVALHRQIAEILEELHRERLEEFAPLLAHHFYAAQDARSLTYDILAGEQAARLYANAEAATHFRRALETAKHFGAETEQIADLYSKLGGLLSLSGHHEQALNIYDDMMAFAQAKKDRSIELNALMAKATIYSIFSQLHNSALSEQMLIQALEISNEIGDRVLQARLNWNLMLTYLFSKRLDEALRHGELALTLARGTEDREQLAFVLNDLCRLYTCRGEFEKAYVVVHEARDLWRDLGNEPMFIDSLGAEAEVGFNAGDYNESLELSTQALQMSEKIENLWGQAYNRMLMSFVEVERGEIGQAIQLMNKAILIGDEASLLASTIGTRSDLAWIYGCYGSINQGLKLVEAALEATKAKQPDWKDLPLAVRVRLCLLNGDIESAEQAAGLFPLKPISIPYARYMILICLANVEWAFAKKDHVLSLKLVDELLNEVTSLTRPDIPEIMRIKADILITLNELEDARQILIRACAMAEKLGSKHELWPILSSLATVNSKLGNDKEAAANREAARRVVEQIAESLREVGLTGSFLSQPRVQKLMRE